MRGMHAAAVVVALSAVACAASACSTSSGQAGPTVTATTTVQVTKPGPTVTAHPVITRVTRTKTRTATVTYTPPPPRQFGEGIYIVGTDIKPGIYRSKGSSDCYWARLSSLDTSHIIDNNNSSGPQVVQVHAGDRAFQVTGTCTFGRAG